MASTDRSSNIYLRKINYADLAHAATALEMQIGMKAKIKPTMILAIGRGGLIPAAMMAYRLGIELLSVTSVGYDEHRQRLKRPVINWPASMLPMLNNMGPQLLVIDELVDSGSTLMAVKEMLPHAQTAVLYLKPCTKFEPDFYGAEIDSKTWVVFPWEKEASN